MATQVCPECNASFSATRSTGTAVLCAKCAARTRGTSPLPTKRKKMPSPDSTNFSATVDLPPAGDANLIAEMHDQPTIEYAPGTEIGTPPTHVLPPPTRGGTTHKLQATDGAVGPSGGRQLGPYEIISEIGRGGMGLVLKGRDDALKREVAIKTLLPDARKNPTHELRFIQEAQIAGQLEHPGIAPVHLLSWDERGNGFFSMKLVAGQTLEQILEKWHKKDGKEGKIRVEYPLPRLVSIFERVCETIGFAHSHRVIHRDLKPANVMIGEFGEVWVLDWGLAKVLGQADARDEQVAKPDRQRGSKSSTPPAPAQSSKVLSKLESNVTLDGTVVGTPGYMAPEQTAGEVIDEGVDIFGLGGLLYEMLCGQAPFTGKSIKELLVNSARGDVKRIPRTVHGRTVPRALAAIAYKCLEFERRDRYASTADLLKDLRAYAAGEPVSALEENAAERVKRFARRHGRALALAGSIVALVVAILIAAGISVWRQDLIVREEREKRLQAEVDKKNAEAGSIEKDRQVRQAELDREAERAQRLQAELDRQKALNAGAEKAQRRLKAFEPYTEAMDLLMRGQLPDRAATLLRSALETDPEFEEAQYALGEALRNGGLPFDAGAAYLKADALSRKIGGKPNLKALVSAGFTYDGAGYYTDAEDAFAAADKDGANDPLAVVGRIFRAGHTRRFREALKLAESVLKSAPHLWETHFAYGYVLLEGIQDGMFPTNPTRDAALTEIHKALELSPRQAEVMNWLAIGLTRSGKHEEALAWSGKAIALEPKNGNRYFQRWMILHEIGRTEVAEKDFADAKRLGISSSEQLLYDVLAANNANDPERAFKIFGQLLKETRDWPSFVSNWAIIGLRLGKVDEVRPVLKRWSEAYPDYWCVRLLRAEIMMKTDPPGALREIAEGLKSNPYQPMLLCVKAEILMGGGRIKDALDTWEKVIELNPADIRSVGERALCLLALKRSDEADAAMEKMKKDFPKNPKDIKNFEDQYLEAKKRLK